MADGDETRARVVRYYRHTLQRLAGDLDLLRDDLDRHEFDLEPRSRCWACRRRGPGLTEIPDGRVVHRWPCRDRLL